MGKCIVCKRKSGGIIRGKNVCKTCFYLLKKDNFKRGTDINNMMIERQCIRCNNYKITKIQYENKVGEPRMSVFRCKDCS